MEQARVVSDARPFCAQYGCCLARAEDVQKADACSDRAQQGIQERNEWRAGKAEESAAVRGAVSQACEDKQARQYDAQVKKAVEERGGCSPMAQAVPPPYPLNRMVVEPGTPMYWVIPAEIMGRFEKLEKEVQAMYEVRVRDQKAVADTFARHNKMVDELRVQMVKRTSDLAHQNAMFRAALIAVGVDPDRIY